MLFRKITFYLLFFSFFSSLIFSQKITVNVFYENKINHAASDTIYYDFNRKLTWSDFQGKVPASVPWGAMTASGFSFNSSMEENENNIEISVGVYTFFTKHDSWKKPNVSSAYHLEHEQHHFDITRLGAQKLVEEIKKAHFTKNNYRKLLNSMFEKVYDETIARQHEYDNETKNSMDIEKQKEWNEKISGEIAQLKYND
ncbi:MAG TPA: hypothetical protein VN722_07455 [Hanamia sp.]|nr:hypothetical protein [Hanamia sp.]